MECVNAKLRVRNRYELFFFLSYSERVFTDYDRLVINVEREKLNATKVDRHVVIAKKTTSPVFTRRFHHTSMY